MIGLIRLTPVEGESICVNPTQITMFGNSTKTFLARMSKEVTHYPGSSFIMVAGMLFQVKETEQEIISCLTRLRKKQEKIIVDLKKDIDREDWQSDNETEDWED